MFYRLQFYFKILLLKFPIILCVRSDKIMHNKASTLHYVALELKSLGVLAPTETQSSLLTRRPHRRRRSVGVANATLPNFASTLSSLPNFSTTSSPEKDKSQKMVYKTNSKEFMVISNLVHFTSYQIEIQACNHPTDPNRCSMPTYVNARTLPERKTATPLFSIVLV